MAIKDIPDIMLAAQVVEFNKSYKIQQVPNPKFLGPHNVLLKTAVASLCQTDSMVQAGPMGTPLPCAGSHEGTGTVVLVGSEVEHMKEGDRVMAAPPRDRCGPCKTCLGPENYRHSCQNLLGYIGVMMNGAIAEYMAPDGRESCVIPDGVSFETAAPLACAGSTGFRGILQTNLEKGGTLALLRAGGGLGHLGIQFFKATELKVVGIDARYEGIASAKESGADVVVSARDEKKRKWWKRRRR